MSWYKLAIRLKTFTMQKALEILGLKPGATEAEVKAARNSLVFQYHPDKVGHNEKIADINDAFAFIRSKGFNTSVDDPFENFRGRRNWEPQWDSDGRRKSWQQEEEEHLRSKNEIPPWQTDLRSSYNEVGDDFRNLNYCKKSIWEESLKNGEVSKYTIWPFDGYFRAPFSVYTNESTLGFAGKAMYLWSTVGANSYSIIAVFAQPNGTRKLKLVNVNGKELSPPWEELEHDSLNENPGNDQSFVKLLQKKFNLI